MRTPIILAAIGGLSIAAISLAADTVDGANAQIDTRVAATNGSSKPEFPKYDTVIKSNYNKVVSTVDGKPGMYTLYVDKKTGGVLAELPRNYAKQNIFFAYTISGGIHSHLDSHHRGATKIHIASQSVALSDGIEEIAHVVSAVHRIDVSRCGTRLGRGFPLGVNGQQVIGGPEFLPPGGLLGQV